MKKDKYTVVTIGYIRTPYVKGEEIPIQGKFDSEIIATVELFDEYVPGLKNLDGFSHAILIYLFNRAGHTNIVGKPYLEDKEHGIFAIRSPFRPNHIGLSVVKIEKIIKNKLIFTEVDMLDQTPLLDIKPYVKYFDHRENTRTGWLEKYFPDNNNIPEVRLKNKI